ncbi:MAG: Uma2 family endonuclease [Anaerolineae bacterium]|nr:Uma2 family endonuclease [Anaerolineae bacterium]
MVAARHYTWTIDDYLAYEGAHQIKHEYVMGYVYAMAGANKAHIRITGSAYASLYNQLSGRDCNVDSVDMRVGTPSGLFSYPDIVIVCGKEETRTDHGTVTLLNPTAIIEVLSPTTEVYDRTTKFDHYKSLSSLQEYVLIAQDERRIECFRRQPNDLWEHSVVRDKGAMLLTSVDCTLALEDVYARVTLDDPAT